MSDTTTWSIEKLNSGTETLCQATSNFAKAGQGIGDTLKATALATNAINGAATTLSGTTSDIKAVLKNNESVCDTFAHITKNLSVIVETAKLEASLTTKIVDSLKEGALQLLGAQNEAEHYLEVLTKVLGDVHGEFSDNLQRTLSSGNKAFQKELSESVQLLNGAVQNLGFAVVPLASRAKS
jgi:ABC-type transporter Mla subunit MlaD